MKLHYGGQGYPCLLRKDIQYTSPINRPMNATSKVMVIVITLQLLQNGHINVENLTCYTAFSDDTKSHVISEWPEQMQRRQDGHKFSAHKCFTKPVNWSITNRLCYFMQN